MDKIKGDKIQVLPFGSLNKISDLIYYEGSILTHFQNKNGDNFLFHWVDFDENLNRWLILQLSNDELCQYLTNIISLNDIFNLKSNNILFIVDINIKAEHKSISLVSTNTINKKYTPDTNSYYNSEISEEYDYLVKKDDKFGVLNILKENAIYLKLKSKINPLANTIIAEDAANFLSSITDSLTNFADIKAREHHTFNISKARLKKELSIRIVDLSFSSFQVGLSIDPFQTENSILTSTWRKDLIEEYKSDVIEVDYNSKLFIDKITKKYTPDERHLIYSSIINTSRSKNYDLIITDKLKNEVGIVKPLTKSNEVILLPPIEKISVTSEPFETVAKIQVTERVGIKPKSKILNIFNQSLATVHFDYEEIRHNDKVYKLKTPLSCKLEIEDDMVLIENAMLGIFAQGETEIEAQNMLFEEFDFIYTRYNELPEDKLSEDVILIRNILNSIVIK